MASERSSLLLSSSSKRERQRRPRPDNPNHRRQIHVRAGQPQFLTTPDLLDDSSTNISENIHTVDTLRGNIPQAQHEINVELTGGGIRNLGASSDGNSHADLIQLEEKGASISQLMSHPPMPTTRSIKKLQARMQLRSKGNSNSDHRPEVLRDEGDDDGVAEELDRNHAHKSVLLDLEAQSEAHPKTTQQISRSPSDQIPPMVDLTTIHNKSRTIANSTPPRSTNTVMNRNNDHDIKSNAFDSLSKKDGMDLDRPLPSRSTMSPLHAPLSKSKKVQSDPLSPPRPFKQPVKHAKRAVSTLFGSSVVVSEEAQNYNLRQTSLLDIVSKKAGLSGRSKPNDTYEHNKYSNGGLEMENKMLPISDHNRQAMPGTRREGDLMDFSSIGSKQGRELNSPDFTQPTVERNSMQNQIHQQDTHQQSQQDPLQARIDVGDPFSYHPHSTMNNRRRNSNQQSYSSVARNWFGNSLNYTTSSIHMSSRDKEDNYSANLVQDHQLLDKLHQEGAERLPVYARGQVKSFEDLKNHMNWLNVALFLSYGFTTAASSVPITLVPTIAMEVLSYGQNDNEEGAQALEGAASKFASTVATYAVLGTAFGKFLNGPLGDIFGARRVACLYALLLSLALILLSSGYTGWGVIACCAAVEFFQSVQWPCVAVILAAHYGNPVDNKDDSEAQESSKGESSTHVRGNVDGKYEKGIYIASLGSRCGSLFASISTTMLLRFQQDSWRVVARLAAMGSFLGCVILYMFVTDSPGKIHDPQNPIKASFHSSRSFRSGRRDVNSISELHYYVRMSADVFSRNVVPSLRSVLSNGTFWVVAIAHSGGLMVCSSVRILGTYFRDTSNGAVSENEAGAVTIFLSIGVLVGLALGGNAFANLSANAVARKRMVANLYILTVAMCYTLAFLAVPFVRKFLISSTLVAILQAMASFCMGAGVAVQVYCIPAIVGCTFGANKGLYASYTDGVACIVSSMVWRIVGNAVQEGNPQGSGWAYGWAAVALLVILAGLLMVEFIEFYFCRGGWLSRLRDANVTNSTNESDPTGGADLNASFAESGKRLWENRPAIFRPTASFKRNHEIQSILSIADDDTDDDASTIVFEDVTLPIDYNHIETSQVSGGPRDTKQEILDLLEVKGNEICIDCGSPFPRWVSIIIPNRIGLNRRGASKPLQNEVACFCCTQCSGSHRKLGNHVVFVRSVDYDSFKSSEVTALRRGGNKKVNGIYEALLQDLTAKPTPSASMATRERFITAKYKKKLWYDFKDSIPLFVDSSLDNSASMSSIELSRIHGTEAKVPSAFEAKAEFDQGTREKYEAFVRRNDSDSEFSIRHNKQKDEESLSSDDSGDWQISQTEMRGLDNLINL